MAMQITPAILPDNFEELHDKLFQLEGVSHRVQIDLCDGRAGLEKTWLPYKEKHLPDGFEYEFDLMVEDWNKFLPRVLLLGAKRVVLHVDTWNSSDFNMLREVARANPKVSFGFSVTNTGPLDILVTKILELEKEHSKVFVQLMGINKIGAQGQPFDDRVLSRIEYVRRNARGIPIQIDGSMNPETIFLVKRSGAAGVVIGSYIFSNRNIRKTIDSLHLSFGA
jgi:pentose-5-phosphate-3-epimerase